ncbi:MAG: zinc-ribbon domain-containing protein [Deltaproteobacteria bacterium]|nr:zinc-ribbon domain-containing protein [Deltaproteobacteria bacterium]
MIVNCPSCKARYDLSGRGQIPDSVRLRCSACQTVFVVRRKASVPPAPASAPRPAAAPGAGQPAIILVAHDSDEVRKLLRDIIAAEKHLQVVEAGDGPSAIGILRSSPVQVIVADVALPGLLGFEISSRLRADDIQGKPRIILLASIYNHTRYKRAPAQLYGADDYLEKHHVHDMLVPKINKLLYNLQVHDDARPAAPADAMQAVTEEAPVPRLTEMQENILKSPEENPVGDPASPAAHEHARRLARIIVSDIALYSEELLAEGLRTSNIRDFLERQFTEARELYNQRVPEAVRRRSDYLEAAIQEYISRVAGGRTA